MKKEKFYARYYFIKLILVFVLINSLLIQYGCNRKERVPHIDKLVELGNTAKFLDEITSNNIKSNQVANVNPSFLIKTYFVINNPVKIDLKHGSIIAKLEINNIPEFYQIPDGEYYLWSGMVNDSLHAIMIKTDKTLMLEPYISYKLISDDNASSLNFQPTVETDFDSLNIPRPKVLFKYQSSGTTSVPYVPPLHRPPPPRPTWVTVKQKQCYVVDGKEICYYVDIKIPDA